MSKRNVKRSRARGVEYEQRIAKELRELGFPGVVTSRAESKNMDDNKIDLIDTEGKLFFYPQLKRTLKCPNYFTIAEQCPLKDKPFVVFWNYQIPTEKTFRSGGELVMLPKQFFYDLIKQYGNL
ncbi:MAG: hypothetical protein KBT03_10320 [Bacteroidales bacterium]|nr:hypothetical protein [Candidatus Scybalousia scybalohippi]